MNDPAIQWVEAARDGDEDAASRLVGEFHGRIFAFLRRLSGSESDAVELTQRTFCRAWASLGSFAGRSKVSVWFHSIAYRTYVDWLRAERRGVDREDEWWQGLEDGGPGPDARLVASDSAAEVYSAVDGLGEGLRETVHLHYYQGLTLDETAEAMGIATSTVKYRLRQALGHLQRALEEKPRARASAPR